MIEKVRGEGFFARFETSPYRPSGIVLGQFYDDSCVAACCRMLLHDSAEDVSEAELRADLQTDGGSYLSAVPETLRQFGLLAGYVYHYDLSLAELRAAVAKGPAIVAVKHLPDDDDAHALVIDRIAREYVYVRDPLPEGAGSAYRVTAEAFLRVWLRSESGTGRAAVVE